MCLFVPAHSKLILTIDLFTFYGSSQDCGLFHDLHYLRNAEITFCPLEWSRKLSKWKIFEPQRTHFLIWWFCRTAFRHYSDLTSSFFEESFVYPKKCNYYRLAGHTIRFYLAGGLRWYQIIRENLDECLSKHN